MAENREDRDLYRVTLGESPTIITDTADVLAHDVHDAIKKAMKFEFTSYEEGKHKIIGVELISCGWIIK